MAVKFEFVVSDIDAENIMSALHSEYCGYFNDIMDRMVELSKAATSPLTEEDYDADSYIKWYKARQVYIKELMAKMKNTRSEEHSYMDREELEAEGL